MTIIIKNVNWSQTDWKIVITVPIPRVSKSKTDLFISSRYIKASYEQYLFEVLLFDKIQSELTQCTFIDNNIIFELIKIEKIQWDSLEITTLNRQERNALKHQLIEEERQNIAKKVETKRQKNAELKRIAVREQIEEDSRVRNVIESVKKAEENKALGDVNEWHNKIIKKVQTKPKNNKTALPPLRSTRSLQIIFTPREFPTPSRESKLEEETEWLQKQTEARRSAGFISEDIRPEERNPQFLKSKGDEFMKNNNYLGAISAYSFGITISKNFVDFYIARSEAQLAIGNYRKAAEDCSEALNLLKPAVPSNLPQRALCIGRRAIALHKLGLNKEAISELQSSLNLLPNPHFESLLKQIKSDYK